MTDRLNSAERLLFLREIATGPMSSLFAGRRRVANSWRRVTIKVLPLSTRRDAEILDGALATARSLASFRHRHLCCAEELAIADGKIAIVSPWIDGVDLARAAEGVRGAGTRFPARAICDVVRSIAVALDAAQYRVPPGADGPLGQIHRDIKPTNVMIDRDGEVKVVDFGTGFTSLAGRTARSRALRQGLAKYLSPARRDGKRDGAAGDVYALGILAIELFRDRWLLRLHGHNPDHDRYLAETVARMGALGLGTPADDLSVRNILLRMVAYDADARPTADEVAHTFRAVADRATGATLESFAVTHLRRLIPVVPGVADDDLAGRFAAPLHSPADLPEIAPTAAQPSATSDVAWEETDAGWRIMEEAELSLDDDSEEVAPAPVDAPPRSDEAQSTSWERRVAPPASAPSPPPPEPVTAAPAPSVTPPAASLAAQARWLTTAVTVGALLFGVIAITSLAALVLLSWR